MQAYKFFQNKDCEYFPCHPTNDKEHFNCLFCFCPLYTLKAKCGGNFTYLPNGIKNCSNCLAPHNETSYEVIMEHIHDVLNLGKLESIADDKIYNK